MANIRLEYSEQQQCFHFGYTNDPAETNGFVTIEDDMSRDEANDFIKRVRKANGNKPLLVEFILNFE